MQLLRRFTELYLDCEMGHSLENPGAEYFGIGSAVENDAINYIIERSATFLQGVILDFTNSCNFSVDPLIDSKFTECENTRFGTSGDSNNGCNNSDSCDE